MFEETHGRSVVKAVSWRVLGTIATTALVYAATRRFVLSLAVGGVEFVSKIGLFWMHERVWERVRFGRRETAPAVIWLTGFSGSGKSTIAEQLTADLRGRGLRVEQLDGDSIREIFPQTGFSRADRDAHIKRVGYLASKLEANGVFVIASFVSPYAESRAFVRGLCKHFVEVHVATPIEECERRDVKGLYAKARRGEITQFTGVDDPYEAPPAPEVRVDTTGTTVRAACDLIIAAVFAARGKAPRPTPVATKRLGTEAA